MRTQLQAMLTKLEAMRDKADELSGSDNENTADKYSDVFGSLDAAITEIEAAIERLAD